MKRREILQDIDTTGMIEGMREKMLDGLTEKLKVERVTDARKVTRDRGTRKVLIACAKEQSRAEKRESERE